MGIASLQFVDKDFTTGRAGEFRLLGTIIIGVIQANNLVHFQLHSIHNISNSVGCYVS